MHCSFYTIHCKRFGKFWLSPLVISGHFSRKQSVEFMSTKFALNDAKSFEWIQWVESNGRESHRSASHRSESHRSQQFLRLNMWAHWAWLAMTNCRTRTVLRVLSLFAGTTVDIADGVLRVGNWPIVATVETVWFLFDRRVIDSICEQSRINLNSSKWAAQVDRRTHGATECAIIAG